MSNIEFNFEGKVVLITGSSSGIGAAAAILFTKAGADVVITGRNAEKLEEVANQCEEISPFYSKPLQVLADVTKEEDLKRLVNTTIEKFDKLDILVNNAGYLQINFITNPEFMDVFKSVLETNLYSVVYLTHLCVEYLAKTKGNIVNVSSIGGIIPYKGFAPYSMSKSALDMFTKCMAAELGAKGIRVNSVNPGVVKTSVLEKCGIEVDAQDHWYESHDKLYPVGRIGVPEDIANDILYLASEESSFKTGTIMVSDGGHLAGNINIYLAK